MLDCSDLVAMKKYYEYLQTYSPDSYKYLFDDLKKFLFNDFTY